MRGSGSIVLALSACLAAFSAQAFTADELADKNAAAKGGLDALHAIQSLRLSGKLLVNNDQIRLAYVETRKRGNQVRVEASLQGLTAVQSYDGSQAWQIQPFQGRKDPEKMPLDDAKDLIEDADIDGPLVDYKSKNYKLDYLGTEDVDGTEAHKIQVTKPDGDVLYVYLDPDYFLEIRIVSRHLVRGAPKETVADFGDYEKVGGVYLPFSIVSGAKGSSDRQKTEYDKAQANVDVGNAYFQFPASAQK
ncbi:MAG: hypothetical protein ISP90_04140 [Nevskia sp.]|nr:hypothetical protein [Nevskia sp.]